MRFPSGGTVNVMKERKILPSAPTAEPDGTGPRLEVRASLWPPAWGLAPEVQAELSGASVTIRAGFSLFGGHLAAEAGSPAFFPWRPLLLWSPT